MALLLSDADPLALIEGWPCEVPLTSFEQALELSVFRSGLSRADWLKRLAGELNKPHLLPLLWLLPRQWKLAPAQLPIRLQALGGLLERSLLTPALLGALADDLPHLWPEASAGPSNPVALWSSSGGAALPRELNQLLTLTTPKPEQHQPATTGSQLSGGLLWQNTGLSHEQSPHERERNRVCAQVLNRLGANRLGGESWSIDGCASSHAWMHQLQEQGWQARAQLRCSVASFGMGASLPLGHGAWSQVPLGLPIRSGLLGRDGQELRSLLPHSCLELELRRSDALFRLQFYQGTEGLCGWEALNDLQRPWQNDRQNGTVHYFGESYSGERLQVLVDLCEVIALIHNLEARDHNLLRGGYGALGFCIDSSALIQQVMEGQCQLYPVLMGGIWRERLIKRANKLENQAGRWLGPYRQALLCLPHDGSPYGAAAASARERLLACQPSSSPFALMQQLKAEGRPGSP